MSEVSSLTSAAEIVQANAISATDVPAILGLSRWGDRWTVYARKLGLIPPQEQTPEMFWGKKLEQPIAQAFSEITDKPILWFDQRVYHKTRPWQCCTPDAFVMATPKRHVLECKTAGLQQAGEWDRDMLNDDGVPDYYLAQVQWQLSTLELDLAYIAVLIAGNDFRIYTIERDPVLEEILLEEAEEFWQRHIMGKVEPAISGSDRARQYLRKRYPREREKLRRATAMETELLVAYANLRVLLDAGDERKRELENQITQAIGDAEGLEWERGKFTWKKTKDRTVISWDELAKSQLVGFDAEQQRELIDQYTHTEPGVRRIYFKAEVGV